MAVDTALTDLSRVKRLSEEFASTNPMHLAWAEEFIGELYDALFNQPSSVKYRSDFPITVWYKGQPAPRKLETNGGSRGENLVDDDRNCYPSDVAYVLTGLASALQIPHQGIEYYIQHAKTEDKINESVVFDDQTIKDLKGLATDITAALTRLRTSKEADEKEAQLQKDAEELKQQAETEATTEKSGGMATAKVVQPTDAGTVADQELEKAVAQTGQLPDSTKERNAFALDQQVRARTERSEFSWIYNRILFDLVGKHGIRPTDQVFLSTLQGQVNTYLQSRSDAQLSNLFANPSGRIDAIKDIYLNLANNVQFVSYLRAQYTGYLATATPEQKEVFLESTGFDSLDVIQENFLKNRSQNLGSEGQKSQFLQDPLKQTEKTLSALIETKIDGATAVNFERVAESLASSMGSKSVAEDLKAPRSPTRADLESFIQQLDAERLAIIFFADPNNPNVVDKALVQNIANNLDLVKNLLISSLTTRFVDQVISHPAAKKRVLGVIEIDQANNPDESSSYAEAQVAVMALASSGPKSDIGAVTDALDSDQKTNHTTELLEQYQQRVQKIWFQLDEETQLIAYRELYGLSDTEANKVVLLDKVQHLRDPATNKLPWNVGLFGAINWEDFLRKAKKEQLLEESKKEQEDRQALLASSDAARERAAQVYLDGLSPKQVEQLRYSALLEELEAGLSYANSVLEKRASGESVSELEWRSAMVALDRVKNRADLAQTLQSANIEGSFLVKFRSTLTELSERQAGLEQELTNSAEESWTQGGETQDGVVIKKYRLTAIETYLTTIEFGAPEILYPEIEVLYQPGFDPNAEIEDGVTQESVLPQSNRLSLHQLKQAKRRQNQLADPRAQIAAQERKDAQVVTKAALDIMKKGKSPHVMAALAVKKYLTDAQFRKSVNNTLKNARKKLMVLSAKMRKNALKGLAGGVIALGMLAQIIGGIIGKVGMAAAGAGTGALVGSMFGPLGTIVGAGIGAGLGWFAGEKLSALNAAKGAELLSPNSSYGSTQTISSSLSPVDPATGTGVAPESGPSTQAASSSGPASATTSTSATSAASTTSAASSTATTAATASAPFLGTVFGASVLMLIPGISMLSIMLLSGYTMFVIFSAFLIPLPTGDLTATNSVQSEYAILTKRAAPNTIADDQTATVVYKVTLQPRRNYRLKVTDVADTANTGFSFQSSRPDKRNPSIDPPASLLNPRISSADFSPNASAQTQEKEYSVTFSNGRKVLIINTASITFDVENAQGDVIATNQTLEATATVSIGDHGVACWPTSGEITQLPGGSYSHNDNGIVYDAYDIAAPMLTRVFSPFDGWAQTGDFGGVGYGKYVIVDSYVQGRWIRLMYAHLFDTPITSTVGTTFANLAINHDSDESNNVGTRVTAGQVIGRVDTTGNSTGNHLHYELMHINGARHSLDPSDPFKLNNIIPIPPSGVVRNGDDVRTCYP